MAYCSFKKLVSPLSIMLGFMINSPSRTGESNTQGLTCFKSLVGSINQQNYFDVTAFLIEQTIPSLACKSKSNVQSANKT